MLYKEDPDYNRIVNLYLITFLMSRWTDNPVFVNDPTYIKEKWNIEEPISASINERKT